jgi:hypothetical protein
VQPFAGRGTVRGGKLRVVRLWLRTLEMTPIADKTSGIKQS